MEHQQHASPPAYISHNPAELNFPSVPQTDISRAHAVAEITLPGLKTVLSPDFQEVDYQTSNGGHESPTSVRSLPRIDPGPGYALVERKSLEPAAVVSPSDGGSVMSVEDRGVRSTSVSMDDPNVRIAAEALSGLGNPGM